MKIDQAAGSDIRIAGHDDHPLSRYACPPITTVAQNLNEIGRLAMDLLFRKLDVEPDGTELPAESHSILLNAEIIRR